MHWKLELLQGLTNIMQSSARAILVVGMFVATLSIYKSMRLIHPSNPVDEVDFLPPLPQRQSSSSQQQQSPSVNQHPQFKSPVAFVISISSCADKKGEPSVIDGAAVLGWSIRKHSKKYGYHLYAFVHESAQDCVQDLKTVGYEVRVVDLPFSINDLQEDLAHVIGEDASCCGDKEFLKLYSYTLTDHELVVHLDVDTLLLQPVDDLLGYLLQDAMNVSIPIIGDNRNASAVVAPSSSKDPIRGSHLDFVFTREYKTPNLIEPFNKSKYGIQGGFFIVRPNVTWFHEMISILKSAHYTDSSGWGLAGYGGYWGSAQIQGFLSWVYPEHYYDRSRFVELNPCIYNTLAMDFSRFSVTHCKDFPHLCGKCRVVDCLDCRATPIEDIKIMHFSTCFKPWKCPRHMHPTRSRCKDLHPIWYRYRQELESNMGIELPANLSTTWRYGKTFGYCLKTGEFRNIYITMNVSQAERPLSPFPTLFSSKSNL